MILRLPRGYRRLEGIRPLAVAQERFADALTHIRRAGTLYEWASQHPERREFSGRAPVYSAPLPNGGPRVVVRHAWHGGLFAPLLRDWWIPPTPAATELVIAAILARAGVPTPPVIAFATYPAAYLFRSVDVMTVEVEGADLAATLANDPDLDRPALHRSLARLFSGLLNAGAWHQDLNAKNILITRNGSGEPHAVLLDVDRVKFVPAGDPHMGSANLDRLRRSMEKFRARGEAALSEDDFVEIERLIGDEEAERASDRATALEEYMP
jgi:hypothetical protein